jgi:hypothetical protein
MYKLARAHKALLSLLFLFGKLINILLILLFLIGTLLYKPEP